MRGWAGHESPANAQYATRYKLPNEG